MSHCDEETLSLLALGEPVPAEAELHLAGCPRCAGELAGLRQVVTAVRDDGAAVTRIAPPPALWSAIAAATGVTTSARHDEVLRHSGLPTVQDEPAVQDAPAVHDAPAVNDAPAVHEMPAGGDGSRIADVSTARDAGSAPAVPFPRATARRPGRPALLLAAAALAIGLLGGGLIGRQLAGDSPSSPTSPPVVAATDLAGLTLAPAAAGRADVVQTGSGRRLDLDVSRLAAPDGFYEVWLIDPTVTKMVPIGVLTGSTGEFSLPAGVDLHSYPLLDISIQPLNGDPKHSGRSVLRGTFAG